MPREEHKYQCNILVTHSLLFQLLLWIWSWQMHNIFQADILHLTHAHIWE